MESGSTGAPGDAFESSDKVVAQGSNAITGTPLSRYAAQPDVVLSQERDLYYADTLLGESVSELVETLLGSRRAMILAPELKAFASCLYFGLTNFAGERHTQTRKLIDPWLPGTVLDTRHVRVSDSRCYLVQFHLS